MVTLPYVPNIKHGRGIGYGREHHSVAAAHNRHTRLSQERGFNGQEKLYLGIKTSWHILDNSNLLTEDNRLGPRLENTLLLLEEPEQRMTQALTKLNQKLELITGFRTLGKALKWSFQKGEVEISGAASSARSRFSYLLRRTTTCEFWTWVK